MIVFQALFIPPDLAHLSIFHLESGIAHASGSTLLWSDILFCNDSEHHVCHKMYATDGGKVGYCQAASDL